MTVTLEQREVQVREAFSRVERVERIAQQIEDTVPEQAEELLEVATEAVASIGPVKLSLAAALLALSDNTVRAWVDQGVLQPVPGSSPAAVDPVRLHQVMHVVHELRAAGRNRDMLTAVWYRLQDQALLDREDLTESLQELRAGRKKTALTQEEEEKARQ